MRKRKQEEMRKYKNLRQRVIYLLEKRNDWLALWDICVSLDIPRTSSRLELRKVLYNLKDTHHIIKRGVCREFYKWVKK